MQKVRWQKSQTTGTEPVLIRYQKKNMLSTLFSSIKSKTKKKATLGQHNKKDFHFELI